MIVNELVTNTVKHARADLHAPRRISLATAEVGGRTTLEYRDDGGGYPATYLGGATGAREVGGLAILRGLARQLGGDLRLRNDGGAVAEIDFPAAPGA